MLTWYVGCDPLDRVRTLEFHVSDPQNTDAAIYMPQLGDALAYPLLQLRDSLQTLKVTVYDGTLLPQLGALQGLEEVFIKHICMDSSLPPNWLPEWKEINAVHITPADDAVNYVSERSRCGITGTVPADWFSNGSTLQDINLSNNRLTGSLPSGMSALTNTRMINLANNMFEGAVPASWASMKGYRPEGQPLADSLLNIDILHNQLVSGLHKVHSLWLLSDS